MITELLQRKNVRINRVLDVGSGAFFLGYLLIKNFNSTYIGVDVLPLSKMKKYRKIMELALGKKIDVVRASATFLPFKDTVFDTTFSLDVLEHLKKPQIAMEEITRVSCERNY